jgi:glycosyltransferase involved in cell wall biosynthesis
MPPKRILIFSLAYFPHVGGAEVALKEITDRIAPEDIEFHMLTLRLGDEPREEKIGNIFVHRVSGGPSYLAKIFFVPRAAFAARMLDRTHRFDALWAMMSYMLFPLVLSSLDRPYLLTLQEGDPFEHVFRRWFIRPFAFLLSIGFRRATAVQAISNYLLTWAKQLGFRGQGEVIPNGVDTAHFAHDYPEEDIASMRQSLGKKQGDVFLVTTSRLVYKNAIDDVIRALALLPANMHFMIYGVGREEANLRALAQELGVYGRVRFLGQISHAEMPLALKACDIFVRPSRSEGMGNSFIEAMAAGLPVIATQEGGIADFLFDAKRNSDKPTTGWAVSAAAPQEIKAAVEEILAHPEQIEKVTQDARTLVRERYEWNLIASHMKELLGKVARARVE